MADKKLKITLVKSPIAAIPKQRATVQALCLRKIRQSVELPHNSARPGFEGGQMPLFRRIPKRGFTDRNSKVITGINLSTLDTRFNEGEEVTIEALLEKGIIKKVNDGVKILGNGELTKKLNVKVNAFSASAKEKIEALGGTCEVI